MLAIFWYAYTQIMDLPWQYPDFRSCTTYIEGAYKNGWVSQGAGFDYGLSLLSRYPGNRSH